MRGLALLGVIAASGTASADVPFGVDAVVGGAADSELAASGHAGVSAWLSRGADGEPFLVGEVTLDVARVPWLSAARELSAAPYSAVGAGFHATSAFDPEEEWYGDYMTFPIAMAAGALVQDGRARRTGGGEGTAMRACWRHADGEPTCVGWFGGRASAVHDDTTSFASVAIYAAPVEGLALGPVRVDAKLGGGTASRGPIEPAAGGPAPSVTSLFWDVGVRGRAGAFDLAVRSGREPYASTDGALSFEDRVAVSASAGGATRFTATAYAARTRWWTMVDAPPAIADTVGGELALAARVEGFDVLARAGVGRSFYPALDASLPVVPSLGARVTVDVQRTFSVLERR